MDGDCTVVVEQKHERIQGEQLEGCYRILEGNGDNSEESENSGDGEKQKDPKDLRVRIQRTGDGLDEEDQNEGEWGLKDSIWCLDLKICGIQ